MPMGSFLRGRVDADGFMLGIVQVNVLEVVRVAWPLCPSCRGERSGHSISAPDKVAIPACYVRLAGGFAT